MDPGTYADRCARILLYRYMVMPARIRASLEQYTEPGEGGSGGPVSLFVKSIHEPSIDEVPIIAAILGSLEGRRVLVYEYERISPSWEPRERVLARLVRASVDRGAPSIIVMPKALPVSIYGSLPERAIRALQESTTIRAAVDHENALYLPEDPPRGRIEIVAKRNSTASYSRVVWLEEQARRHGVRVEAVRYLSDNTQIFSYVFSRGLSGVLERVPVNKLSLYILTLQTCGLLEGLGTIIPLYRRERSEHYIYTINLGRDTVHRIVEALGRAPGGDSMERSRLLVDKFLEGARSVFSRMLGPATGG